MKRQTDCGMLIKQISDSVKKRVDNAARGKDMTLSQMRYLEYIRDNPLERVPLKELEAYFQVAQPTVAGIMARLTKKGLVQMEVSSENVRAKTVSLTEAGRQAVADAEQHRSGTEESLLAPLTEEEAELFERMLIKIRDGLKDS